MNVERMRVIFAEELERYGEPGFARLVRSGWDNSHGGAAALAAMQRVHEETVSEILAAQEASDQ